MSTMSVDESNATRDSVSLTFPLFINREKGFACIASVACRSGNHVFPQTIKHLKNDVPGTCGLAVKKISVSLPRYSSINFSPAS